jgi:hypothetical protein
MRKHALVVGSQIGNLSGVQYDSERMCAALANRGFEVDLRLAGEATRAGILDGYDALISRVRRDDAAVVYYSGHGLYATNRDRLDDLQIIQAIAPTDLAATTEDDFRGITAWELAIKLAQLTAMTRNVTVLLDCCHAAQMTRDAGTLDLVPRALPNPIDMGFRTHLRALEHRYGAVSVHPVGNAEAVRVVACGQTQAAFEHTNALGKRSGIFTQALLEILDAIGDTPISWAAIGDALRARVMRRYALQRPDVEGPAERQIFSLAIDPPRGAVAVSRPALPVAAETRAAEPRAAAAGSPSLRIHAGWITGVAIGDRYAIFPLAAGPARAIATARVLATEPMTATAILESPAALAELPDDVVAIALERAAAKHAVRIVAPAAARAEIAGALADHGLAEAEAEAEAEAAPIATVTVAAGALTIETSAGRLFPPVAYPDALALAAQRLVHLALAHQIRGLVGEHGVTGDAFTITWGQVVDGAPRELPDHGATLAAGDHIYVRIHNHGLLKRYVHVLNVGVRGKITLLTKAIAPAGLPLDGDARCTLGEHYGRLTGLALAWPADLPFDGTPRTDELFVFITAQASSLHGLETHECAMRTGAAPALPAPADAFLVKRLSYLLTPLQTT